MGADENVRTEQSLHASRPGAEIDQTPQDGAGPERSPGTGPPAPAPGPPGRVRLGPHLGALPPKMWRYAYLAIGLVLVLGLGLGLAAHLGGTTTTSPAASSVTGSALRTPAATTPNGTAPSANAQLLHASLRKLLALHSMGSKVAPGFTLTDPLTGAHVSLTHLRSHAIVLTFANAACDDICPVLAAELHQAASLLGHTKVPVTFLTINTDPIETSAAAIQIVNEPSLASLHHWRFLTGPISQLDPVWKAYGISITVNKATRQVSHNNVLYFITPSGTLKWSATPFANEGADGTQTLPTSQITRFAKGIARYAKTLAGQS